MKYSAQQVGGVWCVVNANGDVVESFGIGPAFQRIAERVAERMNEGAA